MGGTMPTMQPEEVLARGNDLVASGGAHGLLTRPRAMLLLQLCRAYAMHSPEKAKEYFDQLNGEPAHKCARSTKRGAFCGALRTGR